MKAKENIISELVEDLKEFKPVANPSKTAILWAAYSFIGTLLAAYYFEGLRAGLYNQLLSYPRFSLEIIFGIGVVVLLAFKILALSIPGTKTKAINIALTFFVLGFASLFAYSFINPSAPVSMVGKRPYCFFESLLYGFITMTGILYISRNRAPFDAAKIGVLGGLAACNISAVVMHAACMYSPHHILEHHFTPILIMAGIGAVSAKFLIKKL